MHLPFPTNRSLGQNDHIPRGSRVQTIRKYSFSNHRENWLTGLPAEPPHPDVSVITIEFADEPHALKIEHTSAWLEGKA
jgi:hypothetical protein